MPYAKSGDFNIYYEVEGEGEPIAFQHGLTNSLEDWRDFGFVDKLKNEYQLILIDALGHGKSDKPHDSKYYGSNSAKDIIAVLDDLNINTTHYFGYSMGGGIGLQLATLFPERLKSMIIGGAGPVVTIDGDTRDKLIQALEGGPNALVDFIEPSGPLSPERKTRIMANDFEALLARIKTPVFPEETPSSPTPDVTSSVSSTAIPFLVFVGESDQFFSHEQLREGYKDVPDLTFFTLPGLDHMQAEQRSDLIVPYVKEFLARVENKGA